MNNGELANLFNETADLLEFTNANVFKIRAFRNAAHVVANLDESIEDLYAAGAVTTIPGLGKGIEGRIREAIRTGDFQDHQRLVEEIPPGLLEMTRLDGVGAVSARLFYEELGIASIDQLEKACMEGRVSQLPRMGEKREKRILESIAHYRQFQGRHLISDVEPVVNWLLDTIRQFDGVIEVAVAGSYRRSRETIGDLDILATAANRPELVLERFTNLHGVQRILGQGPTKASILLFRGIQVDLRVVEPDSFGAALHYFTGSKAHNIAIRNRARSTGLKVSEYGVFRGEERLGGKTEQEVFSLLGLPWIPPELRENEGELQAALAGTLPHLVTREDMVGDLHMHTTASDGRNSIRELATAALELGLQYIAITDHSNHLAIAGGLSAEELEQQGAEILGVEAALAREGVAGAAGAGEGGLGSGESSRPLHILRGVETDILPDGSLDLGEEVLVGLDCVIASVHSSFQMDPAQMTRRLIRAMESRVIDILGHPTGVLLSRRAPLEFDMEEVLLAAREYGVIMELNCNPERLDLNSRNCRRAKELGVMVAINTDSHDVSNLQQIRFGIGVARRGWLEPAQIANCLPFDQLLRHLSRHHPHLGS